MRSDIALGSVTVIMTVLGGAISAFALQKTWQKWLFSGCFVVLGVVGMCYVVRLSDESVASNKETNRNLLGDSEHPPWVAVISLPGRTRFVITNGSDSPAYISSIDLQEDSAASSDRESRRYGPLELPPHVVRIDDKPWTPSDTASHHHFMATITTRAGLFAEEMMLDRAGNNQWARAVRVTQGMRTLKEDVDSDWPRNQNGEVEWRR